MPKNKNALKRFIIIDSLLHSKRGGCSLQEIKDACNAALDEVVTIRTIQSDLEFLQSSEGFNAEIVFVWDDRKKYFSYKDKHYTIFMRPLSEEERLVLRQLFGIVSKFEGIPSVEWLKVTNENDDFLNSVKPVVYYEQNPYLKNIDLLQPIYFATVNKIVLLVNYKPFDKKEEQFLVSPYILKQYNSRWYLFAKDKKVKNILPLPLDRITSIKEKRTEQYEDSEIDFSEFFSDIVGVSHYDLPKEKVVLAVKKSRYPFIETKPLHESQKRIKNKTFENYSNEEYEFISIDVVPNRELINLVLSFGDDMIVVSPKSIRQQIRQLINNQLSKYI